MSKRVKATYRLIRSMSAEEKRFFRKKGRGKRHYYLRIFDMLDEVDRPDMAGIRSIPNWSVHVNRLWQIILSRLREKQYESGTFALIDSIKESIVLLERGLLDLAEQSLQEAEDLARKISSLEAQLWINFYQHALAQFRSEKARINIQEARRSREQILQSLQTEMQVLSLYVHKRQAVSLGNTALDIPMLEDLHYRSLDAGEREMPLRLVTQINRALAVLETDTATNLQSQISYQEAQLKLFEAHPYFRESVPKHYLSVLASLMKAYAQSGDTVRSRNLALQYRSVNMRSRFGEMYKFDCACQLNFTHLLKEQQSAKEKVFLLQKLESQFYCYEESLRVSSAQTYRRNFAISFFELSMQDRADRWAEQAFIHFRRKNASKKGQAGLELIALAGHFVLADYGYMKQKAQTVFQRHRQRQDLLVSEELMLQFFRSHHFALFSKRQLLRHLEQLKEELPSVSLEVVSAELRIDWGGWLERQIIRLQ